MSLMSMLEYVVAVVATRIYCHLCHYFCCVHQCYFIFLVNIDNISAYGAVSYIEDITFFI